MNINNMSDMLIQIDYEAKLDGGDQKTAKLRIEPDGLHVFTEEYIEVKIESITALVGDVRGGEYTNNEPFVPTSFFIGRDIPNVEINFNNEQFILTAHSEITFTQG